MTESNNGKEKKVIFSALKPTGDLTIGNYIGALKNMVALTEDYDCYYAVADLHSLTVENVPADLRRRSYDFLAFFVAIGLDPDKCTLFLQSHVPAHAELAWVLNCYTLFGEARRMTQFKDKSKKAPENVNVGLFAYPTLMAADILLYQADLVPIGKDQQQHLELARNVAERFNGVHGNTFTVPEPYIPKIGGRIMSLAEPEKKMSKSDENQNAFITILDPPEVIIRKFKRAVTDSDMEIRYAEGKDGINNLMSIYSVLTGDSYETIERDFSGKGYGDFKLAVGEVVAEALRPIRENYDRVMKDKAYLEEVYRAGAQKAGYTAEKTMRKVYRKVGFLAK